MVPRVYRRNHDRLAHAQLAKERVCQPFVRARPTGLVEHVLEVRNSALQLTEQRVPFSVLALRPDLARGANRAGNAAAVEDDRQANESPDATQEQRPLHAQRTLTLPVDDDRAIG